MSSPKRLFEKTASKRPRRDSDEKQDHSPRQNVGRNISPPKAKKPAFNPALLSSAFYSGPTMYGGAGASNSSPYNQYAKSKFYDRKKTDIKVTPSAPDNSMSQTSRRILDFLEQYSSPISDAKRVPINKPPLASTSKKTIVHQSFLDCTVRSSPDDASTPSGSRPNRYRELQIPSMATLMKMKRNNCNVSPAASQTPFTASLSSSLTYKPDTYSLKSVADTGNHKNKIRTKLNRRTDRLSEEELPEPVNLPNISLNMTGVKLPTFTMLRPFNVSDGDPKQFMPSKIPDTAPVTGSTGGFKFGQGAVQASQNTRKFFFRDPLDILSSKYGISPGRESEDVKSHDEPSDRKSFCSAKSKKVSEELEREEPSLKHLGNKSAQMWNGNDKVGKDCDKSPALVNGDVRKEPLNNLSSVARVKGKTHFNNNDDNLMSVNPKSDQSDSPGRTTDLTDFIKKQKSQSWWCTECMAQNDNDKLKCVCCEEAKPGGNETTPADTTKNTALSSGLVDFMEKQSSQWACECCMARNDNDKIKCVCCETVKPGATVPPTNVTSSFVYPGMVNFMKTQSAQWPCESCSTRNNDDRIKCVCCEATKPGHESEKSATGFNFGSPQTANAFKFGIDQADAGKSPAADNKPAPEVDKKTPAPTAGFVFGNTAEVKTDTPKVGGFTFGIANGSPAISKESSTPKTGNIFGEKKDVIPAPAVVSPVPAPITFGIKKPEVESNKAVISTSVPVVKTNTFTFSSPSSTVGSVSAIKSDSEKIQGGFGASLTGLSSAAPVKLPGSELSVTSANSTTPKSSAPAFTFGSPQTTKPGGGFGGSTPFQFGAASANTTIPAFKPASVPLTFTFGGKDTGSNVSTNIKPPEPAISGAEALFRIPSTNPGSLFSVPTTSSPVNSLKDKIATGNIASPLQFPSAAQVVPEKPKENPTASPFFGFGSSTSEANTASTGPFKAASAAGPVFTFGSSSAVKSDTTFGASPAPATSLFGAKPLTESEPSNSPSSGMFKPATAPSPFAPSTNLFGSPPLTAAQPPAHAVFGANPLGQAANKPAGGIFGSAAAPQPPSLFPGVSATPPSFSSGNIFGSAPRSNPVAQSSAGPFGSQSLNKTEPNAFMNNTGPSPSGNLFGASPSPAAPSASTGGLFGSGGAAPTPVFGAAIPFGEAPRAQPSQSVGFTFGAADSAMGFGRPSGPPPVYSFGSQSAAPPPSGSQFNFTMGASATGFNPGVNPNGPQRKMKKAVRRTMR